MSEKNTGSTNSVAQTPNLADRRRFFRLTFLLFSLTAALFALDRTKGMTSSNIEVGTHETARATTSAPQGLKIDQTEMPPSQAVAPDVEKTSLADHPFLPPQSALRPKAGVGVGPIDHGVGPTIISEPLSTAGSSQTIGTVNLANVESISHTWGLDRIDQRDPSPDGIFRPTGDGEGVDIYVFDTGVRKTHTELDDRVVGGASFVPGESDPFDDCGDHGTKVASAAAGRNVGAAPGANVYSVKTVACNRQGYIAWVTQGVDWVLAKRSGPSVVNFSFGVPGSERSAYEAQVSRLTAAGIVVVTSAGNGGFDACEFEPASSPAAITVGAIGQHDVVADYSNTGPCVDIFAPGSDNLVASATHDAAFDTSQSGTSFAAPYVAGAAAIYLAQNPEATPAMVRFHLLQSWATTDALTGVEDSPNRLLFIGLTRQQHR